MKIPVLGTGLSGMVGCRLVELLKKDFEFTDLSLETGVDITDFARLKERFGQSPAQVCLHLAALTSVDGCEQEKNQGRESLAWKINVASTQEIASLAKEKGMYLIYVSTEFVFDGQKPPRQKYDENDQPNPINWYGQTKHQGEIAVQKSGAKFSIVRIASPYRNDFPLKLDFVRAIRRRFDQGQVVQAIVDSRFTPTLVDDLAPAVKFLIQSQPQGILHLVGSEPLSPKEAAALIARTFGYSPDLIEPITNEAYFAGRAQRGLNLALANEKAKNYGLVLRSFPQGLSYLREMGAKTK